MISLQSRIETLGVHPALGPEGEGWGVEQNPFELATFLYSIPYPKTVLEIGTGYRAGLARFLTYEYGCRVTTVDVQDYGHAARYPEIKVVVLEWNGLEYPVFEDGFDLVFIDGDHKYPSVEFDYNRYAPLASSVVAFHDIAGLRDCTGVSRFWRELAYTKIGHLRNGFHETIADSDQRAGIGWIVRGK